MNLEKLKRIFLFGMVPCVYLGHSGWTMAQTAPSFANISPIYFPALSLGKLKEDFLTELSGLAVGIRDPEIMWTHNDGKRSELHALRRDGTLAGSVSLGVDVLDMEDIAAGPGPRPATPYLYVGDIGGNRNTVTILRFPEANFPLPSAVREIDVIRLTYPDGNHEVETLMLDPLSGDLFLVTKVASRARFYRASSAQLEGDTPLVMEFVADVSFDAASAGDISSDGTLILLRSATEAIMWNQLHDEKICRSMVDNRHQWRRNTGLLPRSRQASSEYHEEIALYALCRTTMTH